MAEEGPFEEKGLMGNSSAFNTIIPSKLIAKLLDLGINTSTCNWVMDFLTKRPQQGCVLSPFLCSLFTSDCRPVNGSNSIIKFADDTTVIGLITNNDETAYREEIQHLATWCNNNNLLLNTFKTKELIVDFRKEARGTHDTTHINGMAVKRNSSFKFLGIHILAGLSCNINTSSLEAHQRLFFLRTLKKNQHSSDILVNFYHCAIESILTSCFTVWYGSCSVAEHKALQRVVKTAQHITRTPLPAMEDIQKKRCLRCAAAEELAKVAEKSNLTNTTAFNLKPCSSGLGGMLGIIVLLKGPTSSKPQVCDGLHHIVIQYLLVLKRIHGTLHTLKLPSTCRSKTAPKHD
ncbi:gastrula zinc finger protein XlCGF28.1-like [Silurus asotus]|uniref:Gastrula zinc finger protein XlCGF28.1-like n=1 Tax=Silurus asotus TaxID=30991 RepID=A0AAD4ZYG9_SILAS|nr:gastrula zinc finger protein XlCGF28.1-like [Silurus asotus]